MVHYRQINIESSVGYGPTVIAQLTFRSAILAFKSDSTIHLLPTYPPSSSVLTLSLKKCEKTTAFRWCKAERHPDQDKMVCDPTPAENSCNIESSGH
ncbi:hypothetical protein DdX_09406 [Ditylenchus destructor]|uniref:Uncharacterized protein n=1 Tax=Ditylenchus destructor TaxID=166010 RepID=A0AAD4N1V9_9BILA|nr:hypothetical protein DdX_09406 [Ditylenchus destructor]